ncbi:hypothetical protein JK358_19260 [Nocardia sp. 2]|uniref:NERD domain-containing protein n=1 Tax=Nocardia acididurans TaxID=2802282 RepID=A0ABS1M8S6_9NOCA|nr:hypothetical protein [Nocardia acididurans]MBL1076540.1 hypothetical protein [Nocardia acididurans]
MLVKVRNDDPSRLSSTERTVVNWLKSWSGPHAVPGIAVVQCQDADVVVWTPQTCVVVGVHGFTERVTGTLTCAQDQPWMVDGKPAPLDGDANPLERVRQQTVDLAHQLRSAPGREQVPVSGLVLLVPQLGSRVKLEKGALPAGIDVLIGDGPSSLRAYFKTLSEGADPSWDAAQVGQALGALGFAAAASYSDLIAEGFSPPESARNAPPPMSVAPTVRVPSVPVQPYGPTGPEDAAQPKTDAPARGESGSGAPAARPASAGGGGHPGGQTADTPPETPGGRPAASPAGQQVPPPPASGRSSTAGAAVAGASAEAAAAAAYRAVAGTSEPQQTTPAPPHTPPPAQSGGLSGLLGGRQAGPPPVTPATGTPGAQSSGPAPQSGRRWKLFGGRPDPAGASRGRGLFGGRSDSAEAGRGSGLFGGRSDSAEASRGPGQVGGSSGPTTSPGRRGGLFGGSGSGRGGLFGRRPTDSRSGGRSGIFSSPGAAAGAGFGAGLAGGRPGAPAAPQAGPYAGPGGQPQSAPPGFPVWPDRRPGERVPRRRRRPDLMILMGLILLALVLALAVTCGFGGTSTDDDPTPVDRRGTTSVRQGDPTTTTDPTIPKTTIAPPCFPLQPC